MTKPKKKVVVSVYDYWIDKANSIVYAIVKYKNKTKKKKLKHSNLYLVSTKYHE